MTWSLYHCWKRRRICVPTSPPQNPEMHPSSVQQKIPDSFHTFTISIPTTIQPHPPPPPPIIVEGCKEYEIEKLMDSRLSQGKLQYLVKWKDYPNHINWTWEPESRILPKNHKEFHKKHPSAPCSITTKLQFWPMPKPLTEVEIRKQMWPEGKESISERPPSNREIVLPLLPQFFEEIETWRKTHEYQNYLLPNVSCFWFINTEMSMIMHMAEVGEKEHNDKQVDGAPKQKYRYPILAYHQLSTRNRYTNKRLWDTCLLGTDTQPYESLGDQGWSPLNEE